MNPPIVGQNTSIPQSPRNCFLSSSDASPYADQWRPYRDAPNENLSDCQEITFPAHESFSNVSPAAAYEPPVAPPLGIITSGLLDNGKTQLRFPSTHQSSPTRAQLQSATYLLAHKSPAAPTSTLESSPTTPSPRETGHSDAIWCSKWSTLPNGDGIVVTAGADHTIKTWNPLSGATPMKTLRPAASLGIVGLAVDPSEGGADFLVSGSIDSVLCRWSMDGVQEARKELGPSETWGLALHPKSRHLATTAGNATVRIMSSDVENFGEELTTMEATGTFGTSIEYSPDGRFLAVASETGHVSLFDASTGSLVSTFPAHSAPIRSTSFTSSLLVTASDDKRINVFVRFFIFYERVTLLNLREIISRIYELCLVELELAVEDEKAKSRVSEVTKAGL
ncbi:hypothetical protein P7C70_g4579, partial [Phenoliferia sp. Uapishka_3]